MNDKDKKVDELLEHNYDGIEEYDNDLPLWWQGLFWATAIFGVLYVIYYHVGPGLNQEETLALELENIEKKRLWAEQNMDKGGESEQLLALVTDASALATGEKIYVGKCLACHGTKGEGLVGPNLVDDYWIHGGTLDEIKYTIENGVLEKGMLAWKTMLSSDDINAVTAYVWSLHGTNPANQKAKEGVFVERK